MATTPEESSPEGMPPADPFIGSAQRAVEVGRTHATKILGLIVGLAVILSLVFGWQWYEDQQAGKASDLYERAVQALAAPVVAPGEETELATDQLRYTTEAERAKAALQWLDKLQESYGGSGVASAAKLTRAAAHFDLEQYDEAVAAAREFRSADMDADLSFVALELEGAALEAKALGAEAAARTSALEAALAVYAQMKPPPGTPFAARANYHRARVLALLDKRDDAVALYREILSEHEDTDLTADIESRLSVLDPG